MPNAESSKSGRGHFQLTNWARSGTFAPRCTSVAPDRRTGPPGVPGGSLPPGAPNARSGAATATRRTHRRQTRSGLIVDPRHPFIRPAPPGGQADGVRSGVSLANHPALKLGSLSHHGRRAGHNAFKVATATTIAKQKRIQDTAPVAQHALRPTQSLRERRAAAVPCPGQPRGVRMAAGVPPDLGGRDGPAPTGSAPNGRSSHGVP